MASTQVVLTQALGMFSSPVDPRKVSVSTAMTNRRLVCLAATTGPPLENLFGPRPGGPSVAEYSSIEINKTGYMLAS